MKVQYSLGDCVEMGLDEAGRGCFWGPLYAGACIWPPEEDWTEEHREWTPKIGDSKKLSEKKRNAAVTAIKALSVDWGVGSVSVAEIGEKGMTWANQEAFRRAKSACTSGLDPDLLLIDGILGIPDAGCRYETIINGDAEYVPIAAASILAKTGRDTWVAEWCKANPEVAARYDLVSNKGYGTPKHRAALKTYGATKDHRAQFVKNWLPDA